MTALYKAVEEDFAAVVFIIIAAVDVRRVLKDDAMW